MESSTQLCRENGTQEHDAQRSGAALQRIVPEVTLLRPEIVALRAEVARLEEAIRRRDERTAFVMHELRQPLNLLVLTASSLAKRSQGEREGELNRLYAHGLRLDGLISDLKDESFLESGSFALRLASTDLVALMNGALARQLPRLYLSVDGDIPPVDVDRFRVEQVLSNLLVNAEKYGSRLTAPRVEVARRGDDVVVSVTNDGGGISDDERTKVFEPYYRGRDRRPGTGGLGLGLYISRRLIEEHGGRIWADGDAFHTRVSFSLPVPDAGQRLSTTRLVSMK